MTEEEEDERVQELPVLCGEEASSVEEDDLA